MNSVWCWFKFFMSKSSWLCMWTKGIERYWLWTLFLDLSLIYSMSFDIFQNCGKLFPFIHWQRGISGETHGQILNLWIRDFEPIVIIFLISPGQDACVKSYYNSNNRQSTCVYFTEFMFYCLKEVGLVIVFYLETQVSTVVQGTFQGPLSVLVYLLVDRGKKKPFSNIKY